MTSAPLNRRLELARRRASERRAEAHGLSPHKLRAGLVAAYATWRSRLPWRLLPGFLAGPLFDLVGQRYAARFLATWRRHGS